MSENPLPRVEYDVRRGGIQRVHDHTPSRCWAWARADHRRSLAVHVSAGRPCWWMPNVGRKQYAGITEWRAGWLLFAVQVATRPTRPTRPTSPGYRPPLGCGCLADVWGKVHTVSAGCPLHDRDIPPGGPAA